MHNSTKMGVDYIEVLDVITQVNRKIIYLIDLPWYALSF